LTLSRTDDKLISAFSFGGAVAQLGARIDGIDEVAGSNPAGSTNSSMNFTVYILQSLRTGRYYLGQTKNLEERIAYHHANYSKALRNRGPWKVVHTESYGSRSEAMKRESYIKRQKDRRFIEQLISASR
jgi:putative endonuclease